MAINILKNLFQRDPDKNEPQKPANEFRILTQRHIDELQSGEEGKRGLIIKELCLMGDSIVDDLILALEEWYNWSHSDISSITLRISIAQILGILGDAQAINPLIKMAGRVEKTLNHRKTAAESLAQIGKKAFIPMLELLESNDPNSQQLAAWALGKMGNSKAIDYLIPLLSREPFHYPHVRAASNQALTELTGQNFGENIDLW